MYSILLVEDEKLELETLRDYVDWKKLDIGPVYTARNGKRAMECMEEYARGSLAGLRPMEGMSWRLKRKRSWMGIMQNI